ncbi:unnamed protein product [Paramecium primaurelia]|uniref:Chromosome undetermined scaffold_117, whole genome shotgun sequence n=4 Tax=Paramecium TaxID=5884 RepID=A0BMW8_PARTE|nr:uncharacterized protein GSPATT00030522001 [Paramecium tetraurelia]XP_001459303.1 uncharacterized protein GSPATT00024637001 [Paramecium tetraurelia]CAD8095652.1 unnamed protein product [Paramecium primaurelia]CAD8192482.1 unnamed protein product [Paramecium octaurelia]CAD8194218.1 unnamed protein product [Paramecium pentaurelia]CAD8200235.1 unnamed protein product [Paramecium octaurelia]CAK59885.1 unnamed protein product [Paramecium tetraurelia]|eukprot:XP_001427283.1 hypothetical protein (macronuclear) [Paramecium tetraurelia strain d4-2]
MQDVQQPHSSKLDQESATNAKNHLLLVNNITELSNELLQSYKHEIDQLKQELHLMKQRITNNNEEIKNTTQPTLDAMLRDLRQAINTQKDENSKLQSQITEIKKEKSQIQQLIIAATQKVAELEHQVGNYTSS